MGGDKIHQRFVSLLLAVMVVASFALTLLTPFAVSSSVHDYIYIVDSISFTIRTVDTQNNQQGPIIQGFLEPHSIAASPGGKVVFVADKRGINIIDTASTTLTGQINGTQGIDFSDLAVSGDATRLFAADKKSPVVYVYGIGEYDPLFQINLSPGNNPQYIEVSPDGKVLYVATGSRIETYDVSGGSKTGEIGLGSIHALALDINGTYLYAVTGDVNPSTVKVIKTSDMSEAWSVQAGPNAQSICVTPDGKLVFTANHDDLSASIISTK